jgi:hypothetical protein
MMRAVFVGAFGVALAAVAYAEPDDRLPPEAYLDPIDQQIAATGKPVGDRETPCEILIESQVRDGRTYRDVERVPTEQCVKMSEPQRWRGLWRFEFEGSQFCPGERWRCSFDHQPRIWLQPKARFPEGAGPRLGYIYEVEFVGRITAFKGSYGHFGMYDHEIIADEIIAMRELPTLD